MEDNEYEQRARLLTVLKSLEHYTKKQISLKFIFLKGVVYGLGTVIGATVLISVLSYFIVQIFGVEVINTEAIQNIQKQVTE